LFQQSVSKNLIFNSYSTTRYSVYIPMTGWLTYLLTPWSESASELYRPSDRRLSAKWLPTFVDKGATWSAWRKWQDNWVR
jgi:hypothetical protein